MDKLKALTNPDAASNKDGLLGVDLSSWQSGAHTSLLERTGVIVEEYVTINAKVWKWALSVLWSRAFAIQFPEAGE
jgi:hypothetical protein